MSKLSLLALTLLLITAACKKDEPPLTLDQSAITLQHNEKAKLAASESATYTSADTNVAKVATDGSITGMRVGNTTITASAGKKSAICKVTVTPVSLLFREPYLKFSGTALNIKSYEARVLLQEDAESLIYDGENSDVILVIYLVENNKMTATDVILNTTSSITNEVSIFMGERYIYVGQDSGYVIFKDGKGIMAAISIDASLGLNVMYLEDTHIKSGSIIDRLNMAKKLILKNRR